MTLDLTINNTTTSVENITVCDSYNWNDSIYTQSGTYSYNIGPDNNYSFDGVFRERPHHNTFSSMWILTTYDKEQGILLFTYESF